MPQARQVVCVTKPKRWSIHDPIQTIGGVGWTMSEADAITAIEDGRWTFFVDVGEKSVAVIVEYGHEHPYLRTTLDEYEPYTLLSLPDC